MARQFASRLSLLAFAAAAVRGAMTGGDFEGSLKAALLAGAVFFGLGLVFGELARRLVEENVRADIERLKSQTGTQPDNPQDATKPA